MRTTTTLACVPILTAFVAVLSAQPPASSESVDQARAVAGAPVFAQACSSDYCHGSAGTGGGGPNLRERPFTSAFLTRVIAEGVPRTPMPPFDGKLTPDQIGQVVAYVLSLGAARPGAVDDVGAGTAGRGRERTPGAAAPALAPPAPASVSASRHAGGEDVRGDAASGRGIFFDAGQTQNCRFCHTVGHWGGDVGPDLTNAATRTARDLFLGIVAPRAVRESRFATVVVTLRDGRRIEGVKRDDTPDAVRVHDTSSVPPVLRTVLKSDVAAIAEVDRPAMPGDYASRYSLKQLLDLVAFLKAADPASRSGISLMDIF